MDGEMKQNVLGRCPKGKVRIPQLRNSNQNATNNWKEMGMQLECNWNAIESNSNQLECDLKAIGMLLGELAQLSKPRVLWRAF